MIRGIFFDLDGTLVNTHRANYEAYKSALKEYGVELSYTKFKSSIGHQAQTFLPWFAPGLRSEEYLEIAEKKKEYYKKKVHLTVGNKQLIKLLRLLRPDCTVALVTTAKQENAQTVLRHHGLEEHFDLIVVAEDVSKSKPNPECYLLALERTGLRASEVLVFEDSDPGVAAAEAAGLVAIKIAEVGR